MTSPSRASSRRRNQFFLASDAVTCFMRTMYKDGWRAVKAGGTCVCARDSRELLCELSVLGAMNSEFGKIFPRAESAKDAKLGELIDGP
jgi:hypothetical protein